MKIKLTHFLVIFFTCCFFLVILIVYSRNYLILGGEGNYFTNFQLTRETGSFSWGQTLQGVGFPNPTLNALVGIFDFFSLLQKLGVSLKVINTVIAFLVYVLPFLSMFWLLNGILKIRFIISYLLSLFYILNPFSTFHLQGLMFWNTSPFFVLPLIFGSIYRYYLYKLKLFLVFGLLTTILAFSFANIPYLGVFHIFLIISLIIIHNLQVKDLSDKDYYWSILKNIFILETSFILFNSWWFINLVRFQLQDLGSYYPKSFAVGWASYASGDGGIMEKLFSLKTLIPIGNDNFFSDFYNSIPMIIILFIPFFLTTWNLFTEAGKPKNERNIGTVLVFGLILTILFLNKGVNDPFGNIYVWMLNNIPFFIIFKSPLEKFSVLLVFLLSFSLVSIFKNTKNKWPYYLFFIYLAACAIPYVTLNFMPDYQMESDKFISRKYQYKENYFSASQSLNENRLDYRNLSLPGSLNYQVTMLNHDGNKYYRGMDPFIYSVNKPFITAYSALSPTFDSIFNNFSNHSIEGSLNIYNVRKIVINNDIYPSFGFREKESVEKLTGIFSKKDKRQDFDSISIYSRKDFLPHFYTPQTQITTYQTIEMLPMIVSEEDYHIRSAIYFKGNKYNEGKEKKFISSELRKENINSTPVLEYKKINSTKYRIVVHGAKGVFPIVFSESYHEGWKSYLVSRNAPSYKLQVTSYKILDGNADDQATKEELRGFIDKGWITTLGDGKEKEIKHQKWDSTRNVWQGNQVFDYSEKYSIDFISKNFQDTIQNDNLPSSRFYETWFKRPIDDNKNHSLVNGYANSWMIDTNKICNSSLDSRLRGNDKKTGNEGSMCNKNSDGNYDFEVVVEFWPQRLFYIGLAISSATLLACLSYLAWLWIRERFPS